MPRGRLKSGVLFVAAALLATVAFALAQHLPDAPAVNALIPEVQGKSPDKVRDTIIHRLGWPAREVGSGLQIEQWDVDGGVLTYHPLQGPDFQRNGQRTRLIHTNNPVARNLFGNYEMVTTPECSYGMRYWLGNLSVSGDVYTYKDSMQNLDHRAGQKTNFFLQHPNGKVEVKYAADVKPNTRLEAMPNGSTVAILTFVTPDSRFRKTFKIVTDSTSMSLTFEAAEMPFQMTKGWENYWR